MNKSAVNKYIKEQVNESMSQYKYKKSISKSINTSRGQDIRESINEPIY